MRGTIPGLPTPHPLLYQLPSAYLEHDFIGRFVSAFDDLIAPVVLVLDNLHAHLDPRTAPVDLLGWVAEWLAESVDEDRPLDQRRALVAEAVDRHGWRGTRRGLADAIRLEVGVEPEILDSGGTASSSTPDAPLPGSPVPEVTVRVSVPDRTLVDEVRLDQLVAAEVPVHVSYRVEVIDASAPPAPSGQPGPSTPDTR